MKILVIDGQGGKLGKALIERVKAEIPGAYVTAVGTNAVATQTMLKASPDATATGENPVIVACRSADVILGPVGIAIADSLLGEITPTIALAVAQSSAVRVLIPFNRCETLIAGVQNLSGDHLIDDAIRLIKEQSFS